ncbi:PREDICTED: NACHT domain- and WD repeat-containing protein 1-like [Branchiostoma belcheri]|uniref:NACHT domain- and WD repeat-containing protein 1-like n=1 Tax=Branchiostoma belcheri TaxID=7741 RepID=A0A6P5A9U0_BRABE|nr:PREDICTED: NACHT domain- and WD repeat-containing protein 1-like [Branchiostoma belcheri]
MGIGCSVRSSVPSTDFGEDSHETLRAPSSGASPQVGQRPRLRPHRISATSSSSVAVTLYDLGNGEDPFPPESQQSSHAEETPPIVRRLTLTTVEITSHIQTTEVTIAQPREQPSQPGPQKTSQDATDQKPPSQPQSKDATGLQSQDAPAGLKHAAVASSTEPRPPKPPPALPDLRDFSENERKLLCGRVDADVTLRPKLIRVYVVSCAEDSTQERAVLRERVSPALKHHCGMLGYQFELVDVCEGVSEQEVNDPEFLQAALREMDVCMETSLGPQLVILFGQKYGRLMCPTSIPTETFDKLLAAINNSDDKETLCTYYRLDNNSAPPSYQFQPIRHEEGKMDSSDWLNVQERLLRILREGLDEESNLLKSALDHQLCHAFSHPKLQASQVAWFTRRLLQLEEHLADPRAQHFLDILPGGAVNTDAQQRLQGLVEGTTSQLSEATCMANNIPWADGGIDPRANPAHQEYLDCLQTRCQADLTAMVDRAVTEAQAEEQDSRLKFVKTLSLELQQQADFCNTTSQTFHGHDKLLNAIGSHLRTENTLPLVIHGTDGCGRSALAAKIAELVPHWQTEITACVYRAVRLGPSHFSEEQLLWSLCEQLRLLYGPSTRKMQMEMGSLAQDFQYFLSRATPDRPLLLLLEGQLQGGEGGTSLAWLPTSLPPNVSMVLIVKTTDMETAPFLKTLPPDCFMEMSTLPPDECMTIADQLLKDNQRTLSPNQRETFQAATEKCPLPLYATLAAQLATVWRSDDCDVQLPTDVVGLVNHMLDRLEARHGAELVTAVARYITVARHGLDQSALFGLLLQNSEVLRLKKGTELHSVPQSVVLRLLSDMTPVLSKRVQESMVLRTWRSHSIADIIVRRYLGAKDDVRTAHVHLKEFYNRMVATGQGADLHTHWGLVELPYHTFQTEGHHKAIVEYFLKFDWLARALFAGNATLIVSDVSMAAHANPDNSDLCLLSAVLQQSAEALSYDGRQFCVQVVERLVDVMKSTSKDRFPVMCNMFKSASGSPCRQFTTSKVFLKQVAPPSSSSGKSRNGTTFEKAEEEEGNSVDPAGDILTGLFVVKDDPDHVISVSIATGEIRLWDVHSQTPVQVIPGVDQPRQVCCINARHIVVLCNRQLQVYDLEAGKLETTLKGIMNATMPYFGIHDSDHVVALSRNRMYVNVINVTSGDVVSTFKAGEDRFLNSLLISSNGETVVCGDETQKPSPLLVWDLINRKLVHDLRIMGHEFNARLSAITNNGKYVASCCKELIDPDVSLVIVYDLKTGQLFKKLKPGTAVVSLALSEESMSAVLGCGNGLVQVWDLLTGACRHVLEGHTHPIDTLQLAAEGRRCLTFDPSHHDLSIRVWDIMEGQCLAVLTPDQPISCCQIMADGERVVIGLQGRDDIITLELQSSTSSDQLP